MSRTEETIELAWQTYDFHVDIASKLEIEHESVMQYYKDFIKYNINPTKIKKNYVKKKLSKSFVILFNMYKKNLDAITDLIRLHEEEPLEVPNHRSVNIQNLIDLKSITSSLVEELKVYRLKIFENLN